MDIHTISDLSGLSRGQINQLISRWSIDVYGRVYGTARDFTSADAFNFCIAGLASRIGLSMPEIRDLIAAMPMPRRKSSTFQQAETFPGRSVMPDDVLMVVLRKDDTFSCTFVAPEKLGTIINRAPSALIFQAGRIAEEVEAANADS